MPSSPRRFRIIFRAGQSPAPTTVYRTCASSLPCHSEPVTDVTGVGIRPPFYASGGPWPPPTFAASRQRRDLIIAYFPAGVSKEGGTHRPKAVEKEDSVKETHQGFLSRSVKKPIFALQKS